MPLQNGRDKGEAEPLINDDLNIDDARAYVRERIAGVDAAIKALDEARKISEEDLRTEFKC